MAVVGPYGNVDTSTQIASQVGAVRAVISADGQGMWVDSATGIRYVPFPDTTPNQPAITQAAWSSANSGTATITAANNFTPGELINVSGVSPTGYNGTFNILTASATQFTFALATNPGATTSVSGALAQVLPTLVTNAFTTSVSSQQGANALNIGTNPNGQQGQPRRHHRGRSSSTPACDRSTARTSSITRRPGPRSSRSPATVCPEAPGNRSPPWGPASAKTGQPVRMYSATSRPRTR